jgi:hypothetical protein
MTYFYFNNKDMGGTRRSAGRAYSGLAQQEQTMSTQTELEKYFADPYVAAQQARLRAAALRAEAIADLTVAAGRGIARLFRAVLRPSSGFGGHARTAG